MVSTVLKLIRLIPAWLQFSDVYILGIVTLMIFTGLPQKTNYRLLNTKLPHSTGEKSTKRNNLSPTRYSFNHMSLYQKSIKPKNSLLFYQHFQMEIAFFFKFSKNFQYLHCEKNAYYLKNGNPQTYTYWCYNFRI